MDFVLKTDIVASFYLARAYLEKTVQHKIENYIKNKCFNQALHALNQIN